MIEKLEALDRKLFVFLNGLHTDFLDPVMYLISEPLFWIPAYLLLLWGIAKSYNVKTALWALVGIGLVITIADRTSVELFKEVFQRYRPCHNNDLQHTVHLVRHHCGGKYGFVSSHAANYFGIATFCALLIRRRFPRLVFWIYLWAALIAYSRIYLGVHYPADTLVGAALGLVAGGIVYYLFKKTILVRQGFSRSAGS